MLAADVTAPLSLPVFDNSAMDGYAVYADDVAGADTKPVTLPVAEDIPAGRIDQLTLAPGTAHRIMTGAPLPAGATAVVPVEATDAGVDTVEIRSAPRVGQHIRRAGEDVTAGTTVLQTGHVVTPAALGLAAALGLGSLKVRPAATRAGDVDGNRVGVGRHRAPAGADLRVQRDHAGRRGPRSRRRGSRHPDVRRRRRPVQRRARRLRGAG